MIDGEAEAPGPGVSSKQGVEDPGDGRASIRHEVLAPGGLEAPGPEEHRVVPDHLGIEIAFRILPSKDPGVVWIGVGTGNNDAVGSDDGAPFTSRPPSDESQILWVVPVAWSREGLQVRGGDRQHGEDRQDHEGGTAEGTVHTRSS